MTLQKTQDLALEMGLGNMLRDFYDVCNRVPRDIYNTAQNNNSSIGAHMRHSLEFIQIIVEQAESGTIDYESRIRNTIYESDPEAAKIGFAKIIQQLTSLIDDMGANKVVEVMETPGFGIEKIPVASSLGREVLFGIQHSIHHFAVVKILAANNDIEFSKDFGVTSATQAHNKKLLKASKA